MLSIYRPSVSLCICSQQQQLLLLTNVSGLCFVYQSSELGTLDDTENCDWADEHDLSMEAEFALREKRRIEREQRLAEHRIKKQEKEVNKSLVTSKGRISAVKMS